MPKKLPATRSRTGAQKQTSRTKAAGKATATAAPKKAGAAPAKPFEQPARGGSPRNPGHSSGHKGVSRVDYEKRRSFGWFVRVPWQGVIHQKFFSDGAHGGREAALAKAIRYRNLVEKTLGKPRTERIVMASHPRSESGVLGVHRILKEGAPVYEVTWCPEPGTLKRTSVSIRKYGEEGAFRRACALRRKKEREVFGTVIKDV